MRKFAFILLHYNNIGDTIECVDSIFANVKSCQYHIVVVDNDSPNKTGVKLLQKYKDDNRVTVLLNDKNLGFAKGNNVGFGYAKYSLKADYIVMMNNDVLLCDDTFAQRVEEEYESCRFAVLGPMIITPNQPYDCNPQRDSIITKHECVVFILKMIVYCLLNLCSLDLWFKKHVIKQSRNDKKKLIDKRMENIQLHGCFWIFSPLYISCFDGINPKTFLYREEELLYIRIKRAGLKSVYLPSLQIFHKEDGSTNTLFKIERRKRLFGYWHRMVSTWILLKELCN